MKQLWAVPAIEMVVPAHPRAQVKAKAVEA